MNHGLDRNKPLVPGIIYNIQNVKDWIYEDARVHRRVYSSSKLFIII